MVKLTLEIKDNEKTIDVKLVDPPKKQLSEATENELFIAQKFKDLFDNNLLDMLEFDLEFKKD